MKRAGIVFLLLLGAQALAHPEGFSGLRVEVEREKVHAVLTLHTRDLGQWFAAGKYPDYVADVCREIARQPEELIELRLDDSEVKAQAVRAFSPETGMIEVDLDYPAREAKSVEVWSKHLVRLPRGHQQLLFVEDARTEPKRAMGERTLNAEVDSAQFDLPAGQTASATQSSTSMSTHTRSISFFALGVEHILTGYDHLLFLTALLLVCERFRQAATIVTFFTLAHSITLALAALGIVRLPARVVEPAIAASIVYVGVENLTGNHRLIWRAAITFAFGLVHGLGFATALKQVGLGSTAGGVLGPLVKFNLGVEAGQLAVAAVVLPILLALRKQVAFERRWVPACSVLVALVGGYWLLIRLVGS